MTSEAQSLYTIKTSSFEGPFGLLLSLIEKKKLFINDISLAKVTEDYLNYIKELPERDKGELTSFIIIASTLILIKSKSLLPLLTLTDEEESDVESLSRRLRLFDFYTNLSNEIKKDFGKNIIFQRQDRKTDFLVFLPDKEITPNKMMELAEGLVNKIPTKKPIPEVEVKKVVSIEEMIDKLTDRIQNAMKFSFKDFSGHSGQIKTKEEKTVVIVGFLAMLEMVRTGILEALQENNFEDIIIEKQ